MRDDPTEQAGTSKDKPERSNHIEGPVASGHEAEAVDFRDSSGPVYKPTGPVTQYFAEQITVINRQPVAPAPTAPPPPPHFVDRQSELRTLMGWLTSAEPTASLALHGMGGIGKSALTKKLAHAVTDQFPGGVLWTALGTQPDVFHILQHWALAAGGDVRNHTDVLDRAAAVRTLLTSRDRMLVVLDDVWEYECPHLLMRHALPGDAKVVLTTRDADLAKRLRCRVENLNALAEADALSLLTKLLGSLGAYEETAQEIARLLEHTPLALELVAGLVDTPADLSDIARQLVEGPQLSLLQMGPGEIRHESVEASLALSYTALSADMQQRFRCLGAFAPSPFDRSAAAAVWGLDTDPDALDEAAQTLRFLTRRSLLWRQADGLYSQHSLLQAYARAMLKRAGETKRTAKHHVAHYLTVAQEDDWRIIEEAFPQIRHGWEAAKELAPEKLVDYLLALVTFLRSSGRWDDFLEWTVYALEHATAAQEPKIRGQLLNEMGYVYWLWGRQEDALNCLRPALTLCREANDRWGEALSLNLIGLVHRVEGHLDEAMAYFQGSLAIRQEIGDLEGEGFCLQNIGLVHRLSGRHSEALDFLQRGLEVFTRDSHTEGQSLCITNIGRVYRTMGRYNQALKYMQRGLALAREVGDRTAEGETLNSIGDVYRFRGQYRQALAFYQQSFEIQREIDSPVGQAYVIGDAGDIFFALGEYDRAMMHYRRALDLWRQVGDCKREASALNAIGCVHWIRGEHEQAIDVLESSLALHRQVGDQPGEGRALNHLGGVHLDHGDFNRARKYFRQALAIAQETMTRHGEGVVLNNIGLVEMHQGENDIASKNLQRSLSIAQELGELAAEGTVWRNIASLCHQAGQQQEAENAQAEALEIAQQLGYTCNAGIRRWFE